MSGDSSEEKTLPPSAKRLRDARKKGQVQGGPDLVSGITTSLLIAYVWFGAGWIRERLSGLLLAAERVGEVGFTEGLELLLPQAQEVLAAICLPALGIALVGVALTNVAVHGGFIFALEPMTPKLDFLAPDKAMKRLYGAKNWVELGKGAVKTGLLGGALWLLARAALGPLVLTPACGLNCALSVLGDALRPLLGAAVLFYLATGGLDVMVQRWLFRRDMRMSLTEMKRERKDTDGDPHVRGELRRLREQAARGELKRTGFAAATAVIHGGGYAVGLRYVPGETLLPLAVGKASGEAAEQLVALVLAGDGPLFRDPPLAAALFAELKLGGMVPPRHFGSVSRALIAINRR